MARWTPPHTSQVERHLEATHLFSSPRREENSHGDGGTGSENQLPAPERTPNGAGLPGKVRSYVYRLWDNRWEVSAETPYVDRPSYPRSLCSAVTADPPEAGILTNLPQTRLTHGPPQFDSKTVPGMMSRT